MTWTRRILALAMLSAVVPLLQSSVSAADKRVNRKSIKLTSEQLVEVMYNTIHQPPTLPSADDAEKPKKRRPKRPKDPGLVRDEMKDLKDRLVKSWPHKDEKMERWFLLADENADEAVSLTEAKKLSEYLTRDLPRRALAQMHQLPEAEKMIDKIVEKGGQPRPFALPGLPILRVPTKQIWEISRATLVDYDQDSDGKLSAEEIGENRQLAQVAAKMDSDKDKQLTDDEINVFLIGYAQQQALNVASARFAAQMQQMFGCSH